MKLVIEEKIKTIEKSGDENIIFTSEKATDIKNIKTTEKIIEPNDIDFQVDTETFIEKVDNQDGYYTFIYDKENEVWLDEEQSEVDISEYGIELDDDAKDKDMITIDLQDGKITKEYRVHYLLEEAYCEFFDVNSELPVFLKVSIGEQSFDIETTKCQMNFIDQNLKIDMWNINTKPFKVKTVVSL